MAISLNNRYLKPGELAERTFFAPFKPSQSILNEKLQPGEKSEKAQPSLAEKITLIHQMMNVNKAGFRKHWVAEQHKNDTIIKKEIRLRLGLIVRLCLN
jgi:hypothetical protein